MRWRFVPLGFLLCLTGLGCAALLDFSQPAARLAFLPYDPESDIIFPHERHSDKCADCHRGIDPETVLVEEVKDKTTLVRPVKGSCFACHERGQDCALCHRRRRPDVRPRSHTLAFKRAHVAAARAATARCEWCHGQPGSDNGCQRCHNLMKPADHDLRWKNSGHGRAAAHNRDRCWTCHRSDQCARCHNQPPETHTTFFKLGLHGTLAQRRLSACLTCHRYETDCLACHQ